MSDICPDSFEDLVRPETCQKTVGGMVTEFLYGLKDDVANWPEKAAAALRTGLSAYVETVAGSNLVMASGKRLCRLQVKKGSAELKYALQGDSGARSFRATLECNIPGFRAAILGFLAATANKELVILAKTRSGEWHLLGNADEGVEYDTAEAMTGKAGTDPSGADVTFAIDTDAATVYNGDIDSLKTVNGTAATIELGTESVSSTTATLAATVTDNDSTVTKVGFRYRAEGDTNWTNVNVATYTSGSEFTKAVSSLAAGDYVFYAYMVVDGHEIYTNTKAFTIA